MPHRARDTAAAIAERSPDRRPLGAAVALRSLKEHIHDLLIILFLICSKAGVYSQLSRLNRRERYLGRFGTWGWERRLRAGS